MGDLSTVGVHEASGGAWPLVCAPLYDAEQPDFVAIQATSVGLAYDPLHQAYVMAAAIEPNRLVSPTLLVTRVAP